MALLAWLFLVGCLSLPVGTLDDHLAPPKPGAQNEYPAPPKPGNLDDLPSPPKPGGRQFTDRRISPPAVPDALKEIAGKRNGSREGAGLALPCEASP
jgi:hypothetical protein